MKVLKNKLNGGFPPLVLINDKKSDNNKERLIASNINIRQILQTNNTKNILDEIKKKEKLDIVTDL